MILKKRQLLLATLVIALGAAVFINRYYTAPKAESAATVQSGAPQKETDKGANLGDARYVISTDVTLDDTAAQAVANEFFSEAKLRRQTARDESLEALNDIIKDTESSPEAVSKATEAAIAMSNEITVEGDIENLLRAKIGCECLAVLNSGKADIIVENGSLDETSAVQIKDIVVKQTGYSAENITIVESEH